MSTSSLPASARAALPFSGRPATRARRNLKIGVLEGVLATPWVLLSVPGGFILAALLTQIYGIGPAVFGMIVSLPAWSNALQIFYLPVIHRFLKPRDMALAPSWLNLGLWLMLGYMLPLLPTEDPGVASRFLIFFFVLASLCGSLIGVGWTSWVQSWVPSRLRGQYFGRRNLLIQVTTVCFLGLAMALLHDSGDSVLPFQMLIFVAAGFRFLSILWQHLIVTDGDAGGPEISGGWSRDIAAVWTHRPFRIFSVFALWTAFWMNAMGPFVVVYSFDYLELTKSDFAVLTILATLTGGLTMPLWGKLVDRFGCVRTIAASVLVWWGTGYAWAVLTPATSWILYFTWMLGGASAGGFLLGAFNLLFKVIPEGKTTAGVSLHMGISSAAGGIAPVIVGFLLARFSEGSEEQLFAYRVLFVTATTAMLLSVLIALRIPEKSQRITEMKLFGAMRSIRTTMVTLGFGFVNNTNLIRRDGPGKSRENKTDRD